jgi:hypothetical protein
VHSQAATSSGNGNDDKFNWLAIVILPGEGLDTRRIFIVPRDIADQRSYIVEPRQGRAFFVRKADLGRVFWHMRLIAPGCMRPAGSSGFMLPRSGRNNGASS